MHFYRMKPTYDEAQSLVSSLARQDRARLFEWMAADMADRNIGIDFDPRVCGGSARIAGTRIPIWSLVSWRSEGLTDLEILENFPSLELSDLVNAWGYAERHSRENDQEIEENDQEE